jgi:hypothetical protein
MGRVPVLTTVSRAYGFLLGDFPTIVRLAWVPLFIGAGLSYFYGGQAFDAAVEAGVNADPARSMQYVPVQLLIGIVGFLTGIMATVALLQVVIFGDRKPGLYVYLWLGPAERRLIAVTILLFVAAMAGFFALMIVFGFVGALAVAVPVIGLIVPILMFAFPIALVWVSLRLSLISPVVVAENNLGVERSWALTRGNALRLFFVLVLTFAPYIFLSASLFFTVMGGDFPALPAFPDMPADAAKDSAAVKTAMDAFAKNLEVWQLDLMKGMRLHWLEFSILGFLGNLVTTALWAGALGSAYASIAGEKTP